MLLPFQAPSAPQFQREKSTSDFLNNILCKILILQQTFRSTIIIKMLETIWLQGRNKKIYSCGLGIPISLRYLSWHHWLIFLIIMRLLHCLLINSCTILILHQLDQLLPPCGFTTAISSMCIVGKGRVIEARCSSLSQNLMLVHGIQYEQIFMKGKGYGQ